LCSKEGQDKDKICQLKACTPGKHRVKPITAVDDGCLDKCTGNGAREANPCACYHKKNKTATLCDATEICTDAGVHAKAPDCEGLENGKVFGKCMYGSATAKKYCSGLFNGTVCTTTELADEEKATTPSICKISGYDLAKKSTAAFDQTDASKIKICAANERCLITNDTSVVCKPAADISTCAATAAVLKQGQDVEARKKLIFGCTYGNSNQFYCGKDHGWDPNTGSCNRKCSVTAGAKVTAFDVAENCVCYNSKDASSPEQFKYAEFCVKGSNDATNGGKCDPTATSDQDQCAATSR